MTAIIICTLIPLEELPPEPDAEMPDRERERLMNELFQMIDNGALDPKNEVIED